MRTFDKTLENPTLSETERHSLENQKFVAPPLDDELYAESYQLRKAASTMTVAAIEWFRNHIKLLTSQQDHTLSILSIGSGEGDIDVEIIDSLLPEVHSSGKKLRYIALEPNPIHCDHFLKRLETISFNENVEVSVRKDFFEPDQFKREEQYDLVLLTHVLYYFKEPEQAIQTALAQTKENGRVVIVHQTAKGIPQIQQEYMLAAKGDENEMLVAEDIKKLLADRPHQYHHLQACLDITECLDGSENGVKIMSFCLECDLRQLQESTFTKILQAFSSLAEIEDNGRALIREPIGIFVLPAMANKTVVERSPEDKDPVIDYWQLAQGFDWSDIFWSQYQQTQGSSLRLLDIACGTGRWLEAFRCYIQLDEQIQEIIYDYLDPSANSIAQASQKQFPPFQEGVQYINTIQSANLETNSYDLLWSMHGFYMVPVEDLAMVLKKCVGLLNDRGIGFIALATRQSFYVDFYEQYLQIFQQGKGQRFTSAEDIVESLCECGIDYQVHNIRYEEPINVDDRTGLENYIKNEATINSFNKDHTTEELSESQSMSLEQLLSNPKMEAYLGLAE